MNNFSKNYTWRKVLYCFALFILQLSFLIALSYPQRAYSNHQIAYFVNQNSEKPGDVDFYLQGQSFKKQGNWRKALDVWWQGIEGLNKQGHSDPRVAIAFIELVTENGLSEFFNAASSVYYWGFSNRNVFQYKDVLKKELKRLQPLVSDEQYKVWETYYQLEDPLLLNEIKRFWINKDPTPTTLANERLIEHWERIAYARKKYDLGSYTAYGTDDRGLIYIKYGKPTRIKSGFLGSGTTEIRMRVDDFLENKDKTNISNSLYTTQYRTELWMKKQTIIQALVMSNPHPQYEAWVYSSLDPVHPIVYLFGRKESTGTFRLLNGVEDFIPKREFSKSAMVEGISPGAVYQLVYYSNLFILGGIFEQRYNELESIWYQNFANGRTPGLNTIRTIKRNYQTIDQHDLVKSQAPPDISSYDSNKDSVRINCYQTRFIDKENKPVVSIIVFSSPQIFSIENAIQVLDTSPQYALKHTLLLRDKNWNEIQRVSDYPPAGFDNTSVYIIQQSDLINDAVIVAEAFNTKPGYDQNPQKKYFSTNAIAIGKTSLQNKEPLSSDPGVLEISDLMIGEFLPLEQDTTRYPYPVIPRNQISISTSLHLYFEIYHLKPDENGKFGYTVQYQVEQKSKPGVLARLFGRSNRKQVVSLVSNYESDSSTTRENIGFDISKIKPGIYDFVVEVTDKVSKQKKSRKSPFQITKYSKN